MGLEGLTNILQINKFVIRAFNFLSIKDSSARIEFQLTSFFVAAIEAV